MKPQYMIAYHFGKAGLSYTIIGKKSTIFAFLQALLHLLRLLDALTLARLALTSK